MVFNGAYPSMREVSSITITYGKNNCGIIQSMENYKRLLFIINPNAGIKRRENRLSEIIIMFSDYGYETVICFTEKSGDGTELVKKHARDDISLIVCMGGDGTLNEVIEGCISIGWDKPIGYIPAGSTNDFASSLGLPEEPDEAAHRIMTGRGRRIDTGVFNGRGFVYTATTGLFSKTSYETPQAVKNLLGHFAYVMGGIKDLSEFVPMEMTIEADGVQYEGVYSLVSLCNTYSLGGMMNFEESSVDLSDGYFELLMIMKPDDILVLDSIRRALVERDFSTGLVSMVKVKNVKIACKDMPDWSLDGEFEKGSRVNRFSVREGSVTIIC